MPIVAETARVKIANIEKRGPVKADSISVSFDMRLPAGDTTIETFLTNAKGETGGAYFTYMEYFGQ